MFLAVISGISPYRHLLSLFGIHVFCFVPIKICIIIISIIIIIFEMQHIDIIDTDVKF